MTGALWGGGGGGRSRKTGTEQWCKGLISHPCPWVPQSPELWNRTLGHPHSSPEALRCLRQRSAVSWKLGLFASFLSSALSPRPEAGTQLYQLCLSVAAAKPSQCCPESVAEGLVGEVWGLGPTMPPAPKKDPWPLPGCAARTFTCSVHTRDVGRGGKVSENQEEQVRNVYRAVSFSAGLS